MLANNALALDLIDELARRIEDAPVPRAQLHLRDWVRGACLPLLGLRQQVEADAARVCRGQVSASSLHAAAPARISRQT